MTKFATLTVMAALSGPAIALAQNASDLDGNGDGVLTIDEVQAVYPEVTGDMFTAMDTHADGALDGDEVAAAQAAGLIPS